uniref:Large ribosomal subunit protein mL65 n=1 Tax=Pogona vitticeps TaxID=103695 RepID=A0A6J0SW91_9SAUR
MAAPRALRLLRDARLGRGLHTETLTAPASNDPVSDSTAAAAAASSSSSESLYPPVVPSLTAKSKAAARRRYQEFLRKIHDAPSVEEKLRFLTCLQRPKYIVHPQSWAINADRWYQDYTKTAFVPGLPDSVALTEEEKGGEVGGGGLDLAELRSLTCDVLLQEFYYQRKRRPRLFRANEQGPGAALTHLVPALTAHLAGLNPALEASSTLDYKPEVNFYWLRGETVVLRGHRTGRIDPLRFQIDDKPHCQIRIRKQLPEFMPLDYVDPGDIPAIKLLPDRLPLFQKQYYNKIFIGSQLGDPYTYGHTQFHLLPDKVERSRLIALNRSDQIEVPFRANAIASLFAWTGAQAMYQGFWSEADVTQPFVSQAVITSGRYFAFFCYQLNTLALTVGADKSNPRKNICWGTESKPLYEAIEDNDVKGFNDEVLLQLVKLLLNRPKEL